MCKPHYFHAPPSLDPRLLLPTSTTAWPQTTKTNTNEVGALQQVFVCHRLLFLATEYHTILRPSLSKVQRRHHHLHLPRLSL